jgi:hypothetical protein
MTVDLDKLEALARAATHGERECVPSDDWSGMYRGIKAAGHGYIAEPTAHDEADLMMAVPDARFIAACDPTTVLAIIARLRGLHAFWMSEGGPMPLPAPSADDGNPMQSYACLSG